jgi:hypothetical protein
MLERGHFNAFAQRESSAAVSSLSRCDTPLRQVQFGHDFVAIDLRTVHKILIEANADQVPATSGVA